MGDDDGPYGADLALVARVAAGDGSALEAFHGQVQAIIRHCVRRGLARWPGVAVDGRDLEQQVYLTLLQDDCRVLRGYQGRSLLTSWLHTVASRVVSRSLTQMASEQDRQHNLDGRAGPESSSEVDHGPEQKVHARRSREQVQRILAELPAADQLLVQLLVEEELSAVHVADLFGTTADGVRMKKMRLMRRLSKKLKGLWP